MRIFKNLSGMLFGRSGGRQRRRQRHPEIPGIISYAEPLEDRRLLAGVVNVSVDATGGVLIRGNKRSNEVSINLAQPAATPLMAAIAGADTQGFGATRVRFLGGAGGFTIGAVTSLTIRMSKGRDIVDIDGGALALTGIDAILGAGHDQFFLTNSVVDNVSVRGAKGRDTITLDGLGPNILPGTNIFVRANKGRDNVTIDPGAGTLSPILGTATIGASALNDLTVRLGKGSDSLLIDPVDNTTPVATGSLNVRGGKGRDLIRDPFSVFTTGIVNGRSGFDTFAGAATVTTINIP